MTGEGVQGKYSYLLSLDYHSDYNTSVPGKYLCLPIPPEFFGSPGQETEVLQNESCLSSLVRGG